MRKNGLEHHTGFCISKGMGEMAESLNQSKRHTRKKEGSEGVSVGEESRVGEDGGVTESKCSSGDTDYEAPVRRRTLRTSGRRLPGCGPTLRNETGHWGGGRRVGRGPTAGPPDEEGRRKAVRARRGGTSWEEGEDVLCEPEVAEALVGHPQNLGGTAPS